MINSSNDKQKVVLGIVSAWILSSIFLGAGWFIAYRLEFFLGLPLQKILGITFLPPALSLAIGIAWGARIRHVSQNIDGSPPELGSPLDIVLRYVQNTNEQVTLFIVMTFCFMASTPEVSKTILPILGIWFFIARLLFWAGYSRGNLKRAVGFAATFHPTLILLVVSLILMIRNIFAG